ncbi:hypothetical protein [Mycobacteroides abscessus]|uniref:hypothetical protein n=1 Tax=Mycobacteroides abscessus TaxID=36809 RepID=UPI0009A8ED79|nr:hypothetical protein [Mycobacteroides abscessus]SKK37648.1 Uncharacterised protein [Mycobacteroides abscessus subsp. massiliense]SKM35495.1 Uncharacterised protein [Mycobacteroides abscessus subsp. massiliense]SKP09381.1 Uncharacterised protein [Mycobacteroides abscessus subsp. massiliense]SKP94939.1 Uncharacterised protein [Mycobacteroides abscessus subsp. massiliense]SLK59453.1 Uncharacterised protein [Mycobacteroides abscessus subsp. massiliense]
MANQTNKPVAGTPQADLFRSQVVEAIYGSADRDKWSQAKAHGWWNGTTPVNDGTFPTPQ